MDRLTQHMMLFRELVTAALMAPDPREADKIVRRYLRGEITIEEALELVRRLAKPTVR